MSDSLQRQMVRDYLEALWSDRQQLTASIVADGWPKPMVRDGLDMHRQTWDVDRLAQAVEAELSVVRDSPHHRIAWPRRVHHIWPALPGAGMTPVLVGMLLGIDQRVRPSSRGHNFAQYAAEHGPWEVIDPDGEWTDADLVVVSGTDETVRAIRDQMAGRGRVVGYGHRVSFGVVDDHEQRGDLKEVAWQLSRDVVMWRQQGCFSARAVLFCGTDRRRRQFAGLLAEAIAQREVDWGADELDDGAASQRAQALGVAQLKTEVFCDGIGFVALSDRAFDGSRLAPQAVTVHRVAAPAEITQAVDVPVGDLQAAALACPRDRREDWIEALMNLGVTRIAAPGRLQAPPAHWWHDGRTNALSWGRAVTVE